MCGSYRYDRDLTSPRTYRAVSVVFLLFRVLDTANACSLRWGIPFPVPDACQERQSEQDGHDERRDH